MNEKEWAHSVQELVSHHFDEHVPGLVISEGKDLPYAYEVTTYKGTAPSQSNTVPYETDLLIAEKLTQDEWKPRIVIECKLGSITTHDAITYSEKAFTHKKVHPYLRYGILIGERSHYPLPGRLVRHGAYFDFMLSWVSLVPSQHELQNLLSIMLDEVEASRKLEEILYNSRNPNRQRYTVLHRPLRLE